MIAGPYLEVEGKAANELEVAGLEKLDQAGQDDVMQALHRMERAVGSPLALSLAIAGSVRQHVGLGAKTSLVLAILQTVNQVTEARLTTQALQKLSVRGGASGVGINGFFQGGFILDAGHRQRDVFSLAPSSMRNPSEIPALIGRSDISSRWRFRLLVPKGRRISGQDEKRFFDDHAPIPQHEVHETIATVVHGLAAAVVTGDLHAFALALAHLHSCGFKRRELKAQEPFVQEVLAKAQSLGAAGLSSMGPLIYVVHDEDDEVGSLDELANHEDIEDLGTWSGRSSGFELIA